MLKRIFNFAVPMVVSLAMMAGCSRQSPVELPDKPVSGATNEAQTEAGDVADGSPTDREPSEPMADTADGITASEPAQIAPSVPQAEPPAKPDGEAEIAKAESAAIVLTRIADVKLTETHKAMCKVVVGDAMPAIELPNLEGESTSLSSLYGPKASVIVFFDRRLALSRMQLADLTGDVVESFAEHGVRATVIAVNQTAQQAQQSLAEFDVQVPTLVDAQGEGLALVGSERTSRTYVLDSSGKIVWFDIEYSRSTRRELHDAIAHLIAPPAPRDASATDTQPTASTASTPNGDRKPK